MTVVDPTKRDTLGIPRTTVTGGELTNAPPSTCHWFNYTGSPITGCTAPATRHVILGCVHEHVHEADLCDLHADQMRGKFDGNAACNPCRVANCHECIVRLVSDTTLPVSDTRSQGKATRP